MNITAKKDEHRRQLRSSILEAAFAIAVKEGWHALSVRKIADRIGYSVPMIYDHFMNKEAVLLELTRQGFRLLNEKLVTAAEKEINPELQLRLLADCYWEFAHQNTQYYQLMYGLGMPGCEMVKKIPELQDFSQILGGPIGELLKKHEHSDDFHVKFRRFWSLLHGLISLEHLNNTSSPDRDKKVLEDFLENFLLEFNRI